MADIHLSGARSTRRRGAAKPHRNGVVKRHPGQSVSRPAAPPTSNDDEDFVTIPYHPLPPVGRGQRVWRGRLPCGRIIVPYKSTDFEIRRVTYEPAGRGILAALRGVILFCVGTAAVTATACEPGAQDSRPLSAISVMGHSPTRVIQVLDTSDPAARNAAKAAIGALLPGDAYIAVDSETGDVLTSVIVPGPRIEPDKVADCTEKRVGGVGPRCKIVIHELLELHRFRLSVSSGIDDIPSDEIDSIAGESCTTSSGWPYAVIHRLVVGMTEADRSLTNVLVVSGDGDAPDAGQPRLPAELLASLHVVIAPASLACGDHAKAWFAGADSVRLFTSEQPLTTLPSVIFDPPAHQAAIAR